MNKIYCISGLGVDHRLFSSLKIEYAELIFIAWIPFGKDDTMESYAKKLAAQIDKSEPFYLLGVSFGGMLCIELAEILNPQKTFLVSSAKTKKELPWFINLLKVIPAHLLFGDNFYKWAARKLWRSFGFKREEQKLFSEMLDTAPKRFYKRAVDCIVNWKRRDVPPNVFHLHGDNDRILRSGKKHCDKIVKGGTHVMILHNACEVANEISKAF